MRHEDGYSGDPVGRQVGECGGCLLQEVAPNVDHGVVAGCLGEVGEAIVACWR